MLNISFWNIAFTIINVLVLLLFMRHFLMKPVMEILEQRKQMVEKDLDAASTAKSQAEALKTQYAASLENAGEEADRIVAEAREKAQDEYDRIVKKADEDAAKPMDAARKTMDAEREKALNDLRASVTGLAMTAAAKLLAEQSSADHDKKRYDAFIAGAGENHD